MIEKTTIHETVRIKLEESSDPECREFHSRLLLGITGIVGMRTPVFRGIAKDPKESGWQECIKEVPSAWEEKDQGTDGVLCDEMIIWRPCICGDCRDWDTARGYVTAFVPAINNWAVCDVFHGSLEIIGHHKEKVWQFTQPYFQSDGERSLRFGTVMLLSHYADRAYLEYALEPLDSVHHTSYYAKMAAAWTLSVYFVRFPDQAMECLKQNSLDGWTYNKALQKTTESFRMDRETKKLVRQMRRRR